MVSVAPRFYKESNYSQAQFLSNRPNGKSSIELKEFIQKNPLRWSYTNVSYQEFKACYRNPKLSTLLGRKIVIIPFASISLLKAIACIAAALLSPVKKVNIYFAARHLQASAGQLVSLVNDTWGQFIIQKSDFERDCTGLLCGYVQRERSETAAWSSLKRGVMVNNDLRKVTLFNFKSKSDKEQIEFLKKYHLNKYISEFENNNKFDFRKYLDESSDEELKKLNMEELVYPFKKSLLRFAVLTDDEMLNLKPWVDLKEIETDQLIYVRERFLKVDRKTSEDIPLIPSQENKEKITLGDIQSWDSQFLKQHIPSSPDSVTLYLSDEQLKHLKLSDLSEEKNNKIFFKLRNQQIAERIQLFEESVVVEAINNNLLSCRAVGYLQDHLYPKIILTHLDTKVLSRLLPSVMSDEEKIHRLSLLSQSELIACANKGSLPTRYFNWMPSQVLPSIKISALPKEFIDNWFSYKRDSTEDKDIFSQLDAEEVVKAIRNCKITRSYILRLLSDEQLKKVPLSEMTKELIDNWFSYKRDSTEDKDIFSQLDAEEVVKAIRNYKITRSYILGLLSDEQLKKVPLSEMTKEVIDNWFSYKRDSTEDKGIFSQLDAEEVVKAIRNYKITRSYILELLSDEQLKKVPLSEMTKELIDNWFSYKRDSTEDKRIFSQLDTGQISIAFGKGLLSRDYILELFSEELILKLDFQVVPKEFVGMLFSPFKVDTLREKHTSFQSRFISENGKILKDESGNICSKSEEELLALSQEISTRHYNLFKKLSEDQKRAIFSKLDKEHQELVKDLFTLS